MRAWMHAEPSLLHSSDSLIDTPLKHTRVCVSGVPGPAGIAAQQQREHGPPFVGMVHALWTGGSTQQQQQQELRQPLLEAEVQHPQQQSSRPPHLRDSLQQHQLQQDSQPPHPCTAVEVEVQQEPVETVPSNLPPLVAENPDGSVFMVVAAHGVPGGRVAADDGGFHCNSDGTRPAQRSTGIRAVEQERQHVGAPGASVGTGNDADNVVAPSTVEAYLLRGNMSSRTGGRGGADVGSDAGSLAGGAPHGGRPSSATTGDSAAAAARAQAQSAEEAHARAWEDELEAQQAAIDAQVRGRLATSDLLAMLRCGGTSWAQVGPSWVCTSANGLRYDAANGLRCDAPDGLSEQIVDWQREGGR
eukprot:1139955-Pelagomonas_calceolata.AAC.4